MSKIKTTLLAMFFMLVLCFSVSAQTTPSTTPCTTAAGDGGTTTFSNMIYDTYQYLTFTEDTVFSSVTSFTPATNWSIEVCENLTSQANATSTTLLWGVINDTAGSQITARNASSDLALLSSGNYTVNTTTGVVTWDFSPTASGWNGSDIYLCYNKSFIIGITNLSLSTPTQYASKWSVETGATYGDSVGIKLLDTTINNTNWTAVYSDTDRTCSARDACRTTKGVVFAGFGLLAVVMLVLAAFGIISIFSGNTSMPILSATAVGIIGLAVVIMVGYVVIQNVGSVIC